MIKNKKVSIMKKEKSLKQFLKEAHAEQGRDMSIEFMQLSKIAFNDLISLGMKHDLLLTSKIVTDEISRRGW